MNCASVRELLPEAAIGVVDPERYASIDRHVAWCAACRKEARDLERAAATMAFTLAPADPPADLEDRVVQTVRGAQRATGRGPRRRGRTVAVLLAASLGLGAISLGAVAARDASSHAQATLEANRTKNALAKFQDAIRQSEFIDPDAEAMLGVLASPGEARGSGSAMTILAPRVDDQAIVLVSDLPYRPRLLPYRVTLVAGRGLVLTVGAIYALDPGGGTTIARVFDADLTGFTHVVVRDAKGRVVLRGTLNASTPVASPPP